MNRNKRHAPMQRTLMPAIILYILFVGASAGAAPLFTTDELAEGVYLFRPVGESHDRTNSLVVEREHDLPGAR